RRRRGRVLVRLCDCAQTRVVEELLDARAVAQTPELRALKVACADAAVLVLVALVHDLGRRLDAELLRGPDCELRERAEVALLEEVALARRHVAAVVLVGVAQRALDGVLAPVAARRNRRARRRERLALPRVELALPVLVRGGVRARGGAAVRGSGG